MKKVHLKNLIEETFNEAEKELNEMVKETTVDDTINSIGSDDEEETDVVDDYYKPDPDDQLPDEIDPPVVPPVKANLKQMEYELADLKKDLAQMASEYKKTKPAKGSDEYSDYVKKYKELDSKIKKAELAIEDDLESGIYESELLKETFKKRAGLK